ncbi:MAG: TonB-dependent receptor [Opitutaceae bacterium]|nr:TonB-dependent receptor [Opitutaceae bacterium]
MHHTPRLRSLVTTSGLRQLAARSARFLRDCPLTLLVGLTFLAAGGGLRAADPDMAAVTGRVFNQATARYVNNARVVLKGTTRQTFTDQGGAYVLHGVPSGTATLVVYFTNLEPKESTITLAPGQRAELDFTLGDTGASVVRLSEFRVEAAREVDAGAIAANEQRFSRNIKNVTATDSLGELAQNNVGEFVKYLPGVGVEYQGNEIIRVNVRGFGSENTEVTSDGFSSASVFADERENTRAPRLTQSTTVGIARVEVRKVPLPSDSANAMGGSVNLVRRSAFEYARREVNLKGSLNTTGDRITISRTGGPSDDLTRKIRPSFDLSIIDPLSKTLGYTFSVAYSDVMTPWHWGLPGWNYGTPASLTNPQPNLPSIYNPAMQNPLLHQSFARRVRIPVSLRADWRPVPQLTLTPFLSYVSVKSIHRADIRYQWQTGTPRFNDRTQTLGAINGGRVLYINPFEAWRDEDNPTKEAGLIAKWQSRQWQIEGGANFSRATSEFTDTENGFFASVTDLEGRTASITDVTVNLYDLTTLLPQRVEVIDRNGNQVDWSKASSHTLRTATSRPRLIVGDVQSTYLKAKRDFETRIPFSIELGTQYKSEKRDRKRMDVNTWTFVGADGIPNSADDSAGVIAADVYRPERDSEYNSPAIDHLNMAKYYNLYKTHPEYFRFEDAITYRRSAEHVNKLTESVKALYLMADARFFANRVAVTGGVRYERTEGRGVGFLQTPSEVFEREPDGSFRLVNGARVRRAEAGAAGSLAEAKLIYHRKGAEAESVRDGFFPSLHATWNLTESFAFKTAYAFTQAKPNFDRSLLPATIVNANPSADLGTGSLGTITLRNPSLKPWTAGNIDLRLEYYLKKGYVAAGYYVKNIDDYQVTSLRLLETAADAAEFGFGPEFLNWTVNSMFNQGSARISGWEFEGQHSLDPLLPRWAQGFGVRGSLNLSDLDGQSTSGWPGLNRQRGVIWLSYQRPKLRLGVGWIYEGRIDGATATVGGETSTVFVVARSLMDATIDYRLTKRISVFASGNNILKESRKTARESEHLPEWAQVFVDAAFGANFTLGVKASF